MTQKIRLKMDNHEIELEGDEKFITKYLKFFFDKIGSAPLTKAKFTTPSPEGVPQPQAGPKKDMSPAEYIRLKRPRGGTESLIVLAKYLEDYSSLSEFRAKDINNVAKKAKIKKIDGSYYPLAVQQGLLNKIKHGRYSITLSGEDAVSAMPASTK